MKKYFVLLTALSICAFTISYAAAQTSELLSVEEHIAKGDEYYDKFDNENAMKEYKKATVIDTSNCEAQWKLARAYVDVGEVSDEVKQKQCYYLGEKAARIAVRHGSNEAEAHFYLAVAAGRVALNEGGKTKVKKSVEVKKEAEKAIELDPTHDGALHVLARWHREVANLSGILKAFAKILYGGLPPASNEEAVKYFKKAIDLKPNHINHHFELARTYVKMKEWQLAKDEYTKVFELPVDDADDPKHKEEAKEEVKKVDKKLKK